MNKYKVCYNNLSLTLTSCKSKQAACRTAFKYWISNRIIPCQPKTDNNSPSSFEGVTVEVIK